MLKLEKKPLHMKWKIEKGFKYDNVGVNGKGQRSVLCGRSFKLRQLFLI